MFAFSVKAMFMAICLPSGTGTSITFGSIAALQESEGRALEELSSSADRERVDGRPDSSKAKQESDAKAPKSNQEARYTMSQIDADYRAALKTSSKAKDRLSSRVSGLESLYQEKATAETSKTSVAQEMEKAEEELRLAKERRLELTTKDMQTSPLAAGFGGSRKNLEKALASVAKVEDQLVEINKKSRDADQNLKRVESKVARAKQLHAQSVDRADAARQTVKELQSVIKKAQEQQSRTQKDMASAAAEVQRLIGVLKSTLETGAKKMSVDAKKRTNPKPPSGLKDLKSRKESKSEDAYDRASKMLHNASVAKGSL